MIYGGNLMSNFAGSIITGDSDMTKGVVLTQIYRLIDKDPKTLIKALKDSGVSIDEKTSVANLIDKSVDSLYENEKFKIELAKVLSVEGYSNGDGDAIEAGTDAISKIGGGGATGGVVGAIAGAIDSIFGTVGKFKQAKADKDSDKRALQAMLLQGGEKKTNWLPVIIIGGVLLIGGIVAFVSLRNK